MKKQGDDERVRSFSAVLFFLILVIGAIVLGAGQIVQDREAGENMGSPLEKIGIVEPGALVIKLAGGFQFTEGPAVDSEGNVFFTDQPSNRIYKWSVDNQLTVFHENPQRANGLFFDKEGHLLACADLYNRLISIDPRGEITVLVDQYDHKRLNGPNDLWRDSNGGIYFTDPYYQRDYWDHVEMEQDDECVYYLTSDRKKLIRVADGFNKPNGIIGSPDGQLLYIADIGANKTYVFRMGTEGQLLDKTLFAEEGSDGMTIDMEGNVYLTRRSVSVYHSSGKKLGTIEVPEQPANLCFGGKNRQTLFITARTSLYAIQMRVKGL
ncbi:SMP-30/gluconolactonase/LRE family protein [bacterium]|nr:SMP-30/gluconolactonase/LRE family protein [bacterium]